MATLTTGVVRLSYVNIFTPKAAPGSTDLKYSTAILIPKKDTKTVDAIKGAIEAAKQNGLAKLGGKIPANLKQPLRDGDLEKPGEEAYKGMYFMNANNTKQPGIVDAQRQAILDPNKVYSGCNARVNITFYAFAVPTQKGIGCALNHVQFISDGEALDGRISVDAAFADDDFDEMDGMV